MNKDQTTVDRRQKNKNPISLVLGFLYICASPIIFFNVGGFSDLIELDSEVRPYVSVAIFFLGIFQIFFGVDDDGT